MCSVEVFIFYLLRVFFLARAPSRFFVLRSWQHFVRIYIEAEIPRFVHAASTLKIRRKFVLARSSRKCRFLAELKKRRAERVAESLINNKVQFEWKIPPNFFTQTHTIVSRMRQRMVKNKFLSRVYARQSERSKAKCQEQEIVSGSGCVVIKMLSS